MEYLVVVNFHHEKRDIFDYMFNGFLKDELTDKIDIKALTRAFHGHNIFLILYYIDKLSSEGTNEGII
ncbi:MAG: hypothetical protein GF311_12590 [Candidatus Lokiarchaeota archaeon]|nr:hypothetical protein [Candidatus Lokiarchaeota archaeon]